MLTLINVVVFVKFDCQWNFCCENRDECCCCEVSDFASFSVSAFICTELAKSLHPKVTIRLTAQIDCNVCRGGYRSRRKNRSGVGDGKVNVIHHITRSTKIQFAKWLWSCRSSWTCYNQLFTADLVIYWSCLFFWISLTFLVWIRVTAVLISSLTLLWVSHTNSGNFFWIKTVVVCSES